MKAINFLFAAISIIAIFASIALHVMTFLGRIFPYAWVMHIILFVLAVPCVIEVMTAGSSINTLKSVPKLFTYFFVLGICYTAITGFWHYFQYGGIEKADAMKSLLQLRLFSIIWFTISNALASMYWFMLVKK
jgi:hypothetical protein